MSYGNEVNNPVTELETYSDISIRLAGYAQDGIQSIGNFLARLAGRCGHEVMTFMTIPATVAGGNSVFQVRMGKDVHSVGDELDVLVAFYQDSYEQHKSQLKKGGILLYDSDEVTPDLKDAVLVGIPFTAETEKALGGKGRGKNLFVLGLITNAFGLNIDKLRSLIEERFGKKGSEVLKNVFTAFDAGYHYNLNALIPNTRTLKESDLKDSKPQITMDGNQAMAYGLLAAGVRYGASYPITPATSIMETLRAELPKYGGVFLQTEDELAAVCAAIGMSYGGNLATTTTSGPGMSLKMEALSFATMAEIPLVVVNVQRGGPSTGIPTQVEQSDLMQAIWGSHGDNPRPVLAAKNVEDCYYIAFEAAEMARKYSTPVVILSDQILSTRFQGFPQPDLEEGWVEAKIDLTPREEDFKPYDVTKPTRHAAPGTFMRSGKYPTITGLEHDQDGKPNPGPENHMIMSKKRREKIKQIVNDIPEASTDVFGEMEGDVLVVGWGSTFGPIKEAVMDLQANGKKISHYHMRYINPIPKGVAELFSRFKKVLVVEMNDEGIYGFGQLATHLRAVTVAQNVQSLCKTDGLTFKVKEVIDGVNNIINA